MANALVRRMPYNLRRRFNATVPVQVASGQFTKRRRGSASSTTSAGSRTRESAVLSTQRDAQLRYVRKRMPRWRRKRWVSFVRKVNHIEQQAQPLQIYQSVLKKSKTVPSGEQWTDGVLLKDNNMPNQGDLVNIFKDAYGGSGLTTDYDNRRIYLKAAVMDLQIKNIGSEQAIVDVYHIRARKTYQASASSTSDTLNDIWNDTFGDMSTVGSVSSTNPCLTPFDNPSFCKCFLVLRKTEIIISPDQVVTMQLRDPRNRMLQGRMLNLGRFGPLCEGYLMQIRGVPEDTESSSGLTGATIAWSAQSTYHYALPPGSSVESIGQSK